MEGRLEGARIDVEADAAIEEGEGAAGDREIGTRRLAAADGGGRSEAEDLGRGLVVEVLDGRNGGGMSALSDT